ncbi:protein translocase, SecG subunit [Rivularia sp. PCC 7116]|nr:protein translocase, SecG subunit [Rivularia sp. PCC 7116]
MTVSNIIQGIWAFSAIGLIVLVLLHSPKGDGIGAIGGQAQLFSSTKSAENTLNRVTWTLTVVFLGLSVVLSAGWLGASVPSTANPPITPNSAPINSNPSDLSAPVTSPAPSISPAPSDSSEP